MEKKVEIISEKLIKPQVCHIESYNFSSLDQLAPPSHYPIFLYYPHDDHQLQATKSLLLQSSLSKILVDFVPFAGRLINNNNTLISCKNHKDDDFGVLFIEAFAHNYNLQDIMLNCVETNILGQFVPKNIDHQDSLLKDHMLIVQVTFFECGGMILGCWVSHKLSDATSICTFINSWASMARNDVNSSDVSCSDSSVMLPHLCQVVKKCTTFEESDTHQMTFLKSPDFTTGVKVFPPTKNPSPLKFGNLVDQDQQTISKIFLFDGTRIADLKSKALSKDVPSPTRVEAVSALIWKCATASSKSSSSGTSTLSHVVNVRKRLVPSFPSETIGNFLAFLMATKSEKDNNDLPNLVNILRKRLLEFPYSKNGIKSLNWDVALDSILENWNMFGDLLSRSSNLELYHFTSWCGLPFYEADFGWGKPKWMSIMDIQYKNTILLMDSKDDGIEAWICLEVKHMLEFEQNPDLLAFATIK